MDPCAVLTTRAVGKVDLERARRHGTTERVWRGIDVPVPTATDRPARLLATAALHPEAILSGPSALRLFRFDVPVSWPEEITVPIAVRHRPGLRVRAAATPPAHVLEHRGVRATTPARTVADVLRLAPPAEALWIADQALTRGMPRTEISALLPARSRGIRGARTVLALGDGARESALEARVRWLLHDRGLPAPVCQHPEPRASARLDFAWPAHRVALEADGAGWHDAPAALHRDRVRQNALVALGWALLRCTWRDAVDGPLALMTSLEVLLAARSTFAARHADAR